MIDEEQAKIFSELIWETRVNQNLFIKVFKDKSFQSEYDEHTDKLDGIMLEFLSLTLPDALYKRELELELNGIEEALLMELIPFTTTHPAWEAVTKKITECLTRISNQHCRECNKPAKKSKIVCYKCKKVKFCSLRCLKINKTATFGHCKIECNYFIL